MNNETKSITDQIIDKISTQKNQGTITQEVIFTSDHTHFYIISLKVNILNKSRIFILEERNKLTSVQSYIGGYGTLLETLNTLERISPTAAQNANF